MTGRRKLSVRSPFRDQPLGEEVRVVDGLMADLDAPRLVILIHGYQNSELAAERAYDRFRSTMGSALWLRGEEEIGTFWEFHWPGDHPNKLISIATFAARIGDARDSGRLLAEFLGSQSPSQEVVLIAHSLGCRVALNTVAAIKRQGASYRGARIGGLFLMAAAVPESLCDPGRQFGSPLDGSHDYAFYSSRDSVLSKTFPLGSKMYGEGEKAVGASGRPDARWERHAETETSLRHKDYWASYTVAEKIGAYLGYASDRRLPDSHGPAEWEEQAPENTLERHAIADRSLPEAVVNR
jgi:pimeloyl-ACP methyl ester carboxylesterase